MKDQFNGNTEKRRPPPHLPSHEVYEMVKDAHVVPMMHVEKNVCESHSGHCLIWTGKLGIIDMHMLI
jgi:hypothetical protein